MANLSTDVTAVLSYPIQETERGYAVISHEYTDGKIVSCLTRTTKMRRWKLVYKHQTETEAASLRTFWDSRYEDYEAFYWNNPKTAESNIKVKFVPKSWDESVDSYRVSDISVEIQECA